VESCSALGFAGKQLICMQGPFTADLNAAMIRQINARFIVTKDSGEEGGFSEKYRAAKETGAALLVIGREQEEEGISMEALLEQLESKYHLKFSDRTVSASPGATRATNPASPEPDPGHWFPLFTDISRKTFAVIGAGRIAKRRIETLLKFECRIRVIALKALPEIIAYAEDKRLELRIKPYETSDLAGANYVLATTNDSALNHEIYLKCKEAHIPVNVADDRTKSDFYFPGIIRKQGITVGVTADGKDHGLAKRATRAIARCLDGSLQEVEED